MISAVALGAAVMNDAAAQKWPEKPVRIVVPFAPGGGADVIGRILGQRLSEAMGQQFLVENRGGAGSTIGNEFVAKSAPDGYTLLIASAAFTFIPSLYSKLGYDSLKDFAGISLVVRAPFLVTVQPSLPAKTLQEFIRVARARPGQVYYSSSGTGSNTHLAGALFSSLTKVQLTHVPYKGGGPALVAALSGEVAAIFASPEVLLSSIHANKLRPLAVAARERTPVLPNVPTAAEAGVKNYEVAAWYGLSAPAGTPKEIIERLSAEIAKTMAAPDMRERFTRQGSTLIASTPAQFDRFMRDEIAKWTATIREAGIKPE